MKPKTILFLFFVFLACLSAQANDTVQMNGDLNEQLTFYLMDMESGLAHNVVNSIEQDHLGYIWIATVEGISRYNGSAFLNVKQNGQPGNQSLANNFVQQILLRKNGDLMIATDGGLNIYNLREERFGLVQQKDGLLTNSISSLIETPTEGIIVGAYRHGIQILKPNAVVNSSFSHNKIDPSSLSSNQVTSLTMQGDSVVWIGTFDGGLNKLTLKNKSIERVFQKEIDGLPAQIDALYTDKSGNVWVGSKFGLKVITASGDTLLMGKGENEREGLSDREVLSIEQDDQNRMWIGTRNGGLNILSIPDFLNKNELNLFWFLPKSDGSSVFNRTVSALKKDRDGNMWIGTSTGVNFVNPKGEPIKLIQRNPNTPQTLAHNRIGALAGGSKNMLWIGTDGGGLDLFDPKTRSFTNYSHDLEKKSSISNNYIISLLEDSRGRLWAGTYHGGLNRLDQNTIKFHKYLQGNAQNGADVRVIAEDYQQQIWVGTNQGGLYRYSEARDQFDYIVELGKLDIRDIAVDQKQRLWLATFGSGIICFDPQTAEITDYKVEEFEALPGNIYFSIEIMANGEILAGSRYGGLVRIQPNMRMITTITEADGLSNNTISSMVMDDEGMIWLGTYNGISCYNPESGNISHINTFDNIQRSEFNIGAATYSTDGILYFGGNKGINSINPSKLEEEIEKPSLIFENFKLFNDRVSVDHELLDSAIAYKNFLTLNHQQTLFSFDFAILKYPFAQNVNYAYKLENYHEHWIQVQGNGTANLSKIPPGSYNLLVKAEIGNGQQIERNIFITITPPFWKTIPAYLFYFFVLSAVSMSIFRYFSERVKLKNSLLLEKKQRVLEHEINEEKMRFFTSFSHELKTPLTLILAPLEDLFLQIKSKSQLNKLALVQKNAAYLHHLIGNLLEFRKSETGMSQLHIEEHNISLNLEQWIQNYQPLAKRKQLVLTCSLSERNMMARIDLEKLQIIINNLISNAIKHCSPNEKIHVSLWSEVDYLKISVADTGPGIPLEDRNRIFEWFFQSGSKVKKNGTGIGLALAKNLAELHGGSICVESDLKKGATFILGIPKNLALSPPDNWVSDQSNPKTVFETQPYILEDSTLQEHLVKSDEEREVILIIDDNTDIINYLDSLFEKKYDLIHSENGQEGLEKALKYIPDLIISDIMMPLKNGIDLCATLKQDKSTSHIPIILLSAIGSPESMKSGFQEGADAYITKPFNSILLQTRVRNLLDNRKNLRKYFMGQIHDDETLDPHQNNLLVLEKNFLSMLDQIILAQIGKEETQVEIIVQEMGMSRTSLFRKVKAITGYNINAYIRMTKLKKAADLISSNHLTISQAAYESGFNDIKYFRKVFKEYFGQLPSEYKN
ncbi:hybrid sensor histidine kinase/response regulator transcription factor [Rhodonellum sp.]|uniref:hybrid sensor histidine kinase/response regulator transcription factor n=1 Tax=Rhodonellum sp. TaxID=2231180 RepID=UPI00271BF036|nr:hybrid sensor histidine kinase/response regulator transcription factor [Rhodonellum sp.]MDO9552878.1 two-component regulator propeller domain-containing protein [Rhodonellum sp.]